MKLDGCYGFNDESVDALGLFAFTPTGGKLIVKAATVEEKTSFLTYVVSQVEQLLFIGFRLYLTTLVGTVQAFIRNSMAFRRGYPLLLELCDQVFSPRVVDAAAGTSWGKEALTNSMAGDYLWDVLKPVLTCEQLVDPINFDAILKKDALGGKQGDVVQVELELAEGTGQHVKVGPNIYRLDLRIGDLKRFA